MSKKETTEKSKSDSRKVFLSILLILIWSISYGIIVLGENILQASILSLNIISNLISDAIVVIFIGLMMVSFFLLSDFYIRLSIDRLAFVRIEFACNQFKQDRNFASFISNLVHFSQIEVQSNNPIPKSENLALLFISLYYIINVIGMALMTEILFFTVIASSNNFLNTSSIILPILASSLVVGGKVISIYYRYAKEFADMLTETLFVFLLFGIISSLHGASLPGFVDFIPGDQAIQKYLSIVVYLAIIPVAIEITKWFLWIKQHAIEESSS